MKRNRMAGNEKIVQGAGTSADFLSYSDHSLPRRLARATIAKVSDVHIRYRADTGIGWQVK
jgi:hypothetical protein